jgi:prepilin-type N-terminal cleavage/methylation domain-containing protein
MRRGVTLLELLIVLSIIGVMASLLLPAVQRARESAARTECLNHFRQCYMAGSMVESRANKPGPDGKLPPPISPFVTMLPWIDFPLWQRYYEEEPWDSPRNLEVIRYMPKIFTCPNSAVRGERKTVYCIAALLGPIRQGGKDRYVAAGLGTEVSDAYAHGWTDPRGFEPAILDAVAAKDWRNAFFGNHGDGCHAYISGPSTNSYNLAFTADPSVPASVFEDLRKRLAEGL